MIQRSKPLLTKIHELLDGKLDPSFTESISRDYLKAATQTNFRIKQFSKLINEGCYYAALDIANLAPPLTTQIENIRFPREKEWHEYLQNSGIPGFEGFNDQEIQRVKEVCADISVRQPKEYRNFRKGILLKDKQGAIESLRLIVQNYPKDTNAINELQRLESEVFQEISNSLVPLLKRNKQPEILSIIENTINQSWIIELKSDPWNEAYEIYQQDNQQKKIARIEQSISQLKVIQRVGEWEDAKEIVAYLSEAKETKIFELLEKEKQTEIETLLSWYATCEEEENKRIRLREQLGHFQNKLSPENLHNGIAILTKNETKILQSNIQTEWLELQSKLPDETDALSKLYRDAQTTLRNAIESKTKHFHKKHLLWLALIPATLLLVSGFYYIYNEESMLADEVQGAFQSESIADTEEALAAWNRFTKRFLSNHNPFRNYTAHKKTEEVQSWVKDVYSRHQKISDILDKIEINLTQTPSPSELRRIQLNISIVNDLFEKLPDIQSSENHSRYDNLIAEISLIHSEQLKILRDTLSTSLDALESHIAKHFPDNKSDFSKVHEELFETRNLIKKVQNEFRQSFELDKIADLKDQLDANIQIVDEFERNLLTLENNLSKVTSSISLAEYLGILKQMDDLSLRKHPQVIQVNRAVDNIPKFETLAQQLLLPGNPVAWNQFLKNTDRPLTPSTYSAKEYAIYKNLTQNESLKSVYTYRILHYVNGMQTDNIRLVGSLGELESKLDLFQTSGKMIQTIKQFDESKVGIGVPFSERIYIGETTASGDPINGDFLEMDRLSAESGYFKLLDELCAFETSDKTLHRPLLKVIDEIKENTFISPLFKAYLTQEFFNIMIIRALDWGLNFSPTAQIEYQKLNAIKGKLYPYDWLREGPKTRLGPPLEKFYQESSKESYHSQAVASRELFTQIARQRIRYGGFVTSDGRFNLLSSTPSDRKLFGLLENGSIGTLRTPRTEDQPEQTFDGVPYTPILFFNDPPKIILERVTRKTGVDVGAESFKPFLPTIFHE